MVSSKDASTKVFRFNAGGDAFYAIKTPTMTSYTLAEYKTVKRPYLIEYIDSFATPQGAKDTKMPSMKITLSFPRAIQRKRQLHQHRYFQQRSRSTSRKHGC